MALRLDTIGSPQELCVLKKGARVFALLGKATPFGVTAFRREDIGYSWAVTAEFGCIRLERLTGEEEITGLRLALPTSVSYDYGVLAMGGSEDLSRIIFGLLPAEMEELVNAMRRGSFPQLGYSYTDMQCSINSTVIPSRWPHFVVSNAPQYGNVVSLEAFVRVLVSSLPHGRLDARLPNLQSVALQILKLMGSERPGVPFYSDLLTLAPAGVLAGK
jgi:hypothetical protein